jgi:Ribosomal protein L6
MRDVLKTEELDIPNGVDVTVKSRIITVKGPRGTLTKNVRHIDMDIRLLKAKAANKVTLAVWQGGRKHVACLRTIRSLIVNMITGVTKVNLDFLLVFDEESPLSAGIPIQNENSICPFPHQLPHSRERTSTRNP